MFVPVLAENRRGVAAACWPVHQHVLAVKKQLRYTEYTMFPSLHNQSVYFSVLDKLHTQFYNSASVCAKSRDG